MAFEEERREERERAEKEEGRSGERKRGSQKKISDFFGKCERESSVSANGVQNISLSPSLTSPSALIPSQNSLSLSSTPSLSPLPSLSPSSLAPSPSPTPCDTDSFSPCTVCTFGQGGGEGRGVMRYPQKAQKTKQKPQSVFVSVIEIRHAHSPSSPSSPSSPTTHTLSSSSSSSPSLTPSSSSLTSRNSTSYAGAHFFLTQRPKTGLLASFWEFPSLILEEVAIPACLARSEEEKEERKERGKKGVGNGKKNAEGEVGKEELGELRRRQNDFLKEKFAFVLREHDELTEEKPFKEKISKRDKKGNETKKENYPDETTSDDTLVLDVIQRYFLGRLTHLFSHIHQTLLVEHIICSPPSSLSLPLPSSLSPSPSLSHSSETGIKTKENGTWVGREEIQTWAISKGMKKCLSLCEDRKGEKQRKRKREESVEGGRERGGKRKAKSDEGKEKKERRETKKRKMDRQ